VANTLPLTIRMGALPLNFQGTPQEMSDAMVERMTIEAQQSLSLFTKGAAEPSSDTGPWLDTSTNATGIWKNWDDVTGRYQPIAIADTTRRFIASQTAPSPTDYTFWIKLNGSGKALGVYTYYNGAWTDSYTDALTTLQTNIDASVTKPYGSSGTVYTSQGPSNAPVWLAPTGLPVGVYFPYAGNTLPNGYLWCLGQVLPIVTYPTLFAVLGTTFGGDGTSNFGIPDMRGRAPVGAGLGDAADATNWVAGTKRGTEGVAMTEGQLPVHTVTTYVKKLSADGNRENDGGGIAGNYSGDAPLTSNPVGGGQAHPNVPPSLASNWIIRAVA